MVLQNLLGPDKKYSLGAPLMMFNIDSHPAITFLAILNQNGQTWPILENLEQLFRVRYIYIIPLGMSRGGNDTGGARVDADVADTRAIYTSILHTTQYWMPIVAIPSLVLNPYISYYHYNKKLPNLSAFLYLLLAQTDFITMLYYSWYIIYISNKHSNDAIKDVTDLIDVSSVLLISCLITSSALTALLSLSKLVSIRQPFYFMASKTKTVLKAFVIVIIAVNIALSAYSVNDVSYCWNNTDVKAFLIVFPGKTMEIKTKIAVVWAKIIVAIHVNSTPFLTFLCLEIKTCV